MQQSKQILLTFCSIIVIVLFLGNDAYKTWFNEKVWKADLGIENQLPYMDREERLIIRLGNSYNISKNIADYIKKNNLLADSLLILLPPKDYLKQNNVDYPVPEPAVFYYYTGLKSVWANSSNAEKANYAVVYMNKNLRLAPVNKQQLDQLLVLYRKYNISL